MTVNPDDEHEAIRAAQCLERAVLGLRDDIGALRTFGQRNRHFIWGLAVSLALDVVLSIAVAILAVSASNATSLANQNKQAQLVTCKAGNETRAANIQLWAYVLDLANATNPTPTPQQVEGIRQFKIYLAQVYAPRDCDSPTSVKPLPAPPTVPTR
jgi:hypothetical protein